MRFLLKVMLASSLLFSGLAAATPQEDPEAFVRTRAEAVLERIDGKRELIRQDGTEAHDIIREELLPYIDVEYISRLVLASHWRNANEQQRERFTAAFRDFLMRSYASGLAEFTREQLKILPLRGDADPRRTIVQTEVYRDNGQAVPVAYTLRWTDAGWRVYDVIIEGISYVRNYRTDFDAEISQKGLDAVIERLETASDAPAAGGAAE